MIQELEEQWIASREREQVQRIGSRGWGSLAVCCPDPVDSLYQTRDMRCVERVFYDEVAVAFEPPALIICETDVLSLSERHASPRRSTVRVDADYRPFEGAEGSVSSERTG